MSEHQPTPRADRGRPPRRSSRVLRLVASSVGALGGLVALATLALVSAVAVVFGFGWGVLIVAVGLLASALIFVRGSHPGLVLLPLIALVVPAGLMSATRQRLPRQVGSVTVNPARALPTRTLATSTGTLFVDLRRFAFHGGPPSTLHIDGGIGRTIVALPADRCVAVRLRYDIDMGVLHAAARAGGLAADRDDPAWSVFGRTSFGGGRGEVRRWIAPDRPVLLIDYRSQGGALYVRSYPGTGTLYPPDFDDWPGSIVPNPRPTRSGLTRAQFTSALGNWRATTRSNRRVRRLLPGPCRRRR